MPSKILMVDDEPRVLAALKRALRKEPLKFGGPVRRMKHSSC